jgi:hypothetical protein
VTVAAEANAKAGEPRRYQDQKPGFERAQLGFISDMLALDASPTTIAEAAGVRGKSSTGSRTIPRRRKAMLARVGMWPSFPPAH